MDFLLFSLCSGLPQLPIGLQPQSLNLFCPVCAVTKWPMTGLFAVTEPDLLSLRSNVVHRAAFDHPLHVEILTSEVTEWLLSSGQATPTPGVAAALPHCHRLGLVVINMTSVRGRGSHQPGA